MSIAAITLPAVPADARGFAAYRSPTVWRQSLYLLLDLLVGVGLFTAATTLLSTGAGLAITLVGIPLLAVTVVGGRAVATFERVRVRGLLDVDLPTWAPLDLPDGLMAKLRATLTDRPGWKGLAYAGLMLPWGTLTFSLTVTIWALAVGMTSAPLWSLWSDPPPAFTLGDTRVEIEGWGMVGLAAVSTVLGVALLWVLPRIIRGLASADLALARSLLAPSGEQALAQRVAELSASRDASVSSAAGELRRIERDLHDGAQQRMVSVAMQLGQAKERLAEIDDPKAQALVQQAHEEAKLAIAELRNLVRGIHPAVLTDRGLDAAVSALVARCPVPVELTSELGGRRLGPTCEATAYFTIAEALTNVAKHSRANSAEVRMRERDGVLVVEVTDDGVGGAVAGGAGGLHGLMERVQAVEGRLRVASPVGGPTTVRLEVPCAS
ncbi:MAG TPA: histidine kinase [Acidimicrobiaceae bacterium]|nr:histidine kinase [Acidimicrobiaceae bacterium]